MQRKGPQDCSQDPALYTIPNELVDGAKVGILLIFSKYAGMQGMNGLLNCRIGATAVPPDFLRHPTGFEVHGKGNGNAGVFPQARPPGSWPGASTGDGLFHSVEKYCFAASASKGVNTALI